MNDGLKTMYLDTYAEDLNVKRNLKDERTKETAAAVDKDQVPINVQKFGVINLKKQYGNKTINYQTLTHVGWNDRRSHNFYAWFSSVSPISIGMGLRSPALRAGEAPLIFMAY